MTNIELAADIGIPMLWGDQRFKKSTWGGLNVIVGPNGTGKSIFSEQIKGAFLNNGYRVRVLNAERLFGLEKQDYSTFGSRRHGNRGFNLEETAALVSQGEQFGLAGDAFMLLRDNLDIRIRVEAVLSDVFQKTIRFEERGGFLKPYVVDIGRNAEYALQENECHGLKELIALFTFLYDDRYNCIIFDEPELHLHPQYQAFFLQELKRIAGNPKEDSAKKIFFLITHSPFFVDPASIEDLKHILVARYKAPPAYIGELDEEDSYRLKKFIPSLNTHHKQFFFSPCPLFVEGYFDQQIISRLLYRIGKNVYSSGASIIDVGGKDSMDSFLRLSKILEIKARLLLDLDALFKGRVRQTLNVDQQVNQSIQNRGLGVDLMSVLGVVEKSLSELADTLKALQSEEPYVVALKEKLNNCAQDEPHQVRVLVAQALLNHLEELRNLVEEKSRASMSFCQSRINQVIEALEESRVYVLDRGEIENYYVKNQVQFGPSQKDILFGQEIEFIDTVEDQQALRNDYSDLIGKIQKMVPDFSVDLLRHLKFYLLEWIAALQLSVSKGEIADIEALKKSVKLEAARYGKLWEVTSFKLGEKQGEFQGTIVLRIGKMGKEVQVSHKTLPHDFSI